MQTDLQEFLVLGIVPGTNIELSLEAYIICLCTLFLIVEAARTYIYYHYQIRAKRFDRKATRLIAKLSL